MRDDKLREQLWASESELDSAIHQAVAFSKLMTFVVLNSNSETNPFTKDGMEKGWLPVGIECLQESTLERIEKAAANHSVNIQSLLKECAARRQQPGASPANVRRATRDKGVGVGLATGAETPSALEGEEP